MKETASHSNTPVFAENHSCTKPVLFQHPTEAEMRPPTGLKAVLSNFCMAFVMFVCIGSISYIAFISAADEVDHQPQFASESHEKNT